ncbi:MAG: hypothetical protein WC223_00595 [Bacteroidales bacterium]
MLLIGKWERVYIEHPDTNVIQIWNFIDYQEVAITSFDKATGAILQSNYYTGVKLYKVENSKKMKVWNPGNPEGTTDYDIIKLNKNVLRIIRMEGSLDGWNFEFIRMANQ